MAYMRSTIAFALFWLNLIVTSLVIYFAITSKNRYSYGSYNSRYSYHLRGTKQKLLESNPNYFLESTQTIKYRHAILYNICRYCCLIFRFYNYVFILFNRK